MSCDELEAQLRRARGFALRLVAGQMGLALLAGAVGWLAAGARAGLAALLGGGIGMLASLYAAMTVFRLQASSEPGKILRRVYRAEIYKFVITACLFAAALSLLEVSFGPMLAGFAATLIAYWIALGMQGTGTWSGQ